VLLGIVYLGVLALVWTSGAERPPPSMYTSASRAARIRLRPLFAWMQKKSIRFFRSSVDREQLLDAFVRERHLRSTFSDCQIVVRPSTAHSSRAAWALLAAGRRRTSRVLHDDARVSMAECPKAAAERKTGAPDRHADGPQRFNAGAARFAKAIPCSSTPAMMRSDFDLKRRRSWMQS